MPIESTLHGALRSFVRWRSGIEIVRPAGALVWARDLAPLGSRFIGYTWAAPQRPAASRAFGICPLVCRPPYALSEIEPAIFAPESNPAAIDAPRDDDLDYFLVIELFNADLARANLAMLVAHREWQILDQHVLTKRSMAAWA